MDLHYPDLTRHSPWMNPPGIAVVATIAAGALLLVRAEGSTGTLVMLAAALAVAAAHLVMSVATADRTAPRSTQVAAIGAPVFGLAGLAWILAGAITGSDASPLRDGALLVLAGCFMLALSFVAHAPREWLVAFTVAAAVPGAWLMLAPDAHDASGSFRAVAALAAIGGLSMTTFPAVQLTTSRTVSGNEQGLKSSLFWFTSGLSLVLLSSALMTRDDQWQAWHLPLLALSQLVLGLDRSDRRSARPSERSTAFLDAFPVWAGIMGSLFLAVAAAAWTMAAEESRERSGVVVLAVVVVVVYTTTLSISGLMRSSTMNQLSGYAATLLRQSRTDPLTGLANRRAIEERFSAELQRAARFNHPLSIGMIDIDDFKAINDTWGHQSGDDVLRHVAHRLELELRQIDVVGRYGGEEFLMLLPETAVEGAWIAADRVVRSIREMAPQGAGEPRSVTISIGLASFPDHGRSEADLIAATDAALYAAKRAGKNQVAVAER
ncbi:MAG: GGDEF domain-containing protein [Thermomicrobiales bacterium]|nr:GGDEF domain-containing protein [Thermomicrobiales bacterium]